MDNYDLFTAEEKILINKFHSHVGGINWQILEEFILKNQHVARPIIGHCFETWFDRLINKLGYKTKVVGGDDTIDRVLNGKTLQLKTPYKNGTKEGIKVAYALHKTHGIEKRPYNLYKPEKFADFLVGKLTKDKVLICPKEFIPKKGIYLADPAYFDWKNKWINRFDLLDIALEGDLPILTPKRINLLFPKLGDITYLSDIEIIKTILSPENFRVLEQNLKGSIRQIHFLAKAKELAISLEEPSMDSETRTRIKVDLIDKNGKRIQVKGCTKNLCSKYMLGVEVKGSHGRIPQRLYKRTDFDFLAVVIDPKIIPKNKIVNNTKYNFVIFPVDILPSHKNSYKQVYSWTMKFKDGSTKILYSNNPKKGILDVNKTKEWNDDYLKDIFYFDVRKVKINDFSLLLIKN